MVDMAIVCVCLHQVYSYLFAKQDVTKTVQRHPEMQMESAVVRFRLLHEEVKLFISSMAS